MTAVINMLPEGYFQNKDLERLLSELRPLVEQREVMHRKEAADFIGVNVRTLDRLCTDGDLPFHRLKGLEGTRLFLRSELIQFIKKS